MVNTLLLERKTANLNKCICQFYFTMLKETWLYTNKSQLLWYSWRHGGGGIQLTSSGWWWVGVWQIFLGFASNLGKTRQFWALCLTVTQIRDLWCCRSSTQGTVQSLHRHIKIHFCTGTLIYFRFAYITLSPVGRAVESINDLLKMLK